MRVFEELPVRLAAACLGVTIAACEPLPGSEASSSSGGGSTSSSSGGSSGSTSSAKRRPINAEKLCTRLITECKQAATMDLCLRQFTAMLVTGTCADALSTASCNDLTTSSSPVLNTCFPPCNGTLAECNGDGSITTCTTAGTTTVLDCEAACEADGARVYSGTCGTSYGLQVAEQPQCFCK